MRIGVVCSLGSPWARDLVLRLQAAGLEPEAIDFEAPDVSGYYLSVADPHQAESLDRFRRLIPTHGLTSRLRGEVRYVTTAPDLRRLAETRGYRVLLALYGGGRALQLRLSGVRPYGVYLMGSDVLRLGGVRRSASSWSLDGAGLLVANGEHLAQAARRLVPGRFVHALCLGVDLSRFSPSAVRRDGPVRLVCTRGFNEVYNNAAIIEGLARLPLDGPAWECTFTSGGPLLDEMRALAAVRLGSVASRVRFLGGVTSDVLRETLMDADVFVSMSRSDGTSVSLLEAIACGVYPVVSAIPANVEWIAADGALGSVVALDDDRALGVALAEAIAGTARRERARPALRALAESKADAARSARQLGAWLGALADTPGGRDAA